jgi:hypothetical protein
MSACTKKYFKFVLNHSRNPLDIYLKRFSASEFSDLLEILLGTELITELSLSEGPGLVMGVLQKLLLKCGPGRL